MGLPSCWGFSQHEIFPFPIVLSLHPLCKAPSWSSLRHWSPPQLIFLTHSGRISPLCSKLGCCTLHLCVTPKSWWLFRVGNPAWGHHPWGHLGALAAPMCWSGAEPSTSTGREINECEMKKNPISWCFKIEGICSLRKAALSFQHSCSKAVRRDLSDSHQH